MFGALVLAVVTALCSPAGAQAAARYPVLLAHGGAGSPRDFTEMVRRLQADGYRTYTVDFGFPGVDTVRNAGLIAKRVDEIKAETGAAKVHLIGHSMGGVSTRYYVKKLDGLPNVASYTAFGIPQHGARKKGEGPFDPCSPLALVPDQCPTGPVLTALNAGDDAPGEIHYTSIAGSQAPDEADGSWHPLDHGACLPLVDGGPHGDEPGNPVVYQAVKDGLEARCPSGPTDLPDINP